MNDKLKRIIYLYPEIDLLVRAINEELFVTSDELQSRTQESFIVYARMIYTKICRYDIGGMTLTEIGSSLKRNHATIGHYLTQYDEKYKYDKRFRKMVDKVQAKYEQLKKEQNGVE